MEGSRIVTGTLAMLSTGTDLDGVASHVKNLLYTVEVSAGMKRTQNAIRFTLYHQIKEAPLLSVLFADLSLFNGMPPNMDETASFAIRSGFTDSLAVLKKMTCLSYDYGRYELEKEVQTKLEDNRSIDISRDYQTLLAESVHEPSKQSHGDEPIAAASNSAAMFGVQPSKEKDKALMNLAKLKEAMINKSLRNNEMLHRKHLILDKGEKTVIVTVVKEENPLYKEGG